MIDLFEEVLYGLFVPDKRDNPLAGISLDVTLDEGGDDPKAIAKALVTAFLITLFGERHRDAGLALEIIKRKAASATWKDLAGFFLAAREMIHDEIASAHHKFPEVKERLTALREWISDSNIKKYDHETMEKVWSFFFPEGTGIFCEQLERIEALRAKRTVKVTRPNPSPLTDPGRQILFTSNALFTIPDPSSPLDDLPLGNELKQELLQTVSEEQLYWYDHPIQMGVKQEQNEVLYGLRALSEAVEFERKRGNMPEDKITCVLSVSVTHQGLQKVVKRHLHEEISRSGDMKNIDLYIFTEADATSIIEEILVPAARYYKGCDDAHYLLDMFGVDGEYGRHYSFLKAISAFWNVLIEPEIKATFKIDLDQVFPQKELLQQSGASAFDHFKTPLWGAHGVDFRGKSVELGMIAGALVNERDLGRGLFMPDVVFPDRPALPEDRFFFSTLPQALSTEAEMMTRYITEDLDGEKNCIQRIHVTGGTNGILVESLRRHRPFTPSFMGRAEDQAYILSVLNRPGTQLTYVHKDGLIMRHDKEAFARDAIKAASTGKLVGDYIRTLLFSKYALVLGRDIQELKQVIDPFTGCFVSLTPITIVLLRFCLRAYSFFDAGEDDRGYEFITMGAQRIRNAVKFTTGPNSRIKEIYEKERQGWNLYYDLLSELEQGLRENDPFALEIRKKANGIVKRCLSI